MDRNTLNSQETQTHDRHELLRDRLGRADQLVDETVTSSQEIEKTLVGKPLKSATRSLLRVKDCGGRRTN